MLSHLIWDEYDQRMLQMDREDQAMAGQERFPEARFKREYLVFKFGQFTANRILELKDSTELPNNSILHVFDNISHLDEPPIDIPRIDEQPFIDRESFRKFIYHIRDFNLEGPINYSDKYIFRQSGLPANLLKFRSQHGSRFRYLNSLEEIPPRREALSIINHNPLFRVRMFGRLQTYRRLTLIFTSILNTVCALQKYNKNQFLYIPWGPEVYDRSLFIRNRTDLSIVSIKRPEDPHYFFMMHLVNFLWEDATTSIFKKLPEDILSQITLILNAGNKYLFYNLKDLVDLNQHKNKIYFKCLNQLNMLSLVGRTDQDIAPNEDTIINDAIKKSVVSSKEGENTTEITVIEPNVSASESKNTNTQEIDTAPSQHDSAVENIINKAVKTINKTVAPTPTTRGVATAPITEITKSPAPSITKKELKELTQTKQLNTVIEKDKVKPNTPAPTDMKEIVSEYMQEGDREALEFIENNENLSIGQKRRYERLANKYKEIKVGDKTIAQIISESDDIALHPEVIEADKVGDIPDKSALKSSVISFDKTYMEKSFDKHLLEAIVSFRKNGAYLTDLKVEHENDRMNNFVHYTCKYEDINGKTSTVKFRLPQITRDGRIRIDGNYQVLKKQRINLPIVKISDTEVSLASNYNKTRIERNINKAHNYFSYIDNLINNNEKSTAVIEYGNCWINLPLAYEYSTISERYRHITFRKDNVNWDLWFDYKTREDHFDGKLEQMTALESQYGTYFGKTNNEWLFIDNQNKIFAINKRGGEIPDWKYSDLLSILELSLKEGITNKKQLTEYVNIKILDKMLPVIFLLGFRYGLRRTLDYLGVKYVITEPRTRVIVGGSGMENYNEFLPDIPGQEGFLTSYFSAMLWFVRLISSTWSRWTKKEAIVFYWVNGKVNKKKGTISFNSLKLSYWDPKDRKPMTILQSFDKLEDKDYKIVVPKRMPIIKTWKGNFFYIEDILKIVPELARDLKQNTKIDKKYQKYLDKHLYAFWYIVHRQLMDYLKEQGCELYVDKTIKERKDINGNYYREGNESIDNESLLDNFILTDQFIKPLWKEVLDRYQQSAGFDLSYMSYEITDQSHYNDGKSSNMTAQEWAGNWTKNQIIYLNTHALEAYKHFEQKTPDLVTFKLFMKSIIAHELAHEVLANLAKEEYKRRIIDQAKELQFTTNYLQAIKNRTSNKNKYESELFCEFLAFEVLNDTANKLIDSRLTANTVIANTTERRYTPQSGDIAIRFADRVLWFNRYPLDKSLIVSGLDYFDCEQYELSALESPDIYYRMLQDKGLSTNYLKGISSFFDLFVDNMTYEVLRRMGEPTTVRGLLARAAQMLSTLDYRPPSSRENHRLRGMEQVPALVYNEMSRQFATYQARRGKANSFAINPDAIFLRFISNASLVTSEDTNPIRCLEEKSEMTYAGAGGRSSDSFVLRDRAYAVDDIGVISEATVDNYKVAINAQLSLNAGITDTLGTLKAENIDSLQPADVLSNAALLFPFSTNDDTKRIEY